MSIKRMKLAALLAVPLILLVPLRLVGERNKERARVMERRRITKALADECSSPGPEWSKVRYLLEHGADPNAQVYGSTAFQNLHIALNSNPASIQLFLKHGANPNIRFFDSETPLMTATVQGDVETVRLLLSKGANVEAVGTCGAFVGGTALSIAHCALTFPESHAMIVKHHKIIDLLKAAGAKDGFLGRQSLLKTASKD